MHRAWVHGHILLILLILLALPGTHPARAQAPDTDAALDHGEIDCATLQVFGELLITPELGETACGVVQVPENWERPGDRRLAITYVILRSTSDQPAPDPVIYLEGGPGQSALTSIGAYAANFVEMRETRDIVFFDQRGTDFSSPLQCSTFTVAELLGSLEPAAADADDAAVAAVIAEDLLPRTDTAEMLNEARYTEATGAAACAGQLLAAGVDLRQYNSIASSRDLMALIGALGIAQYNLYGISYGTRLALVVMRDHRGSGLRSVVLDSTFPPEIRGFEVFPAEAHEVVMKLFADCSLDAACNAAYPDLKQRFVRLLDQLRAEPVMTPAGLPVTALDLVFLMSSLSQTIPAVPYIPLMILELEQGETTTFDRIVSGELSGRNLDDLSELFETDPELNAEGTPIAADPFAVIPEIGSDGEPLTLAELFISSVEVRARPLPEAERDNVIFLLTMLDKLPPTEATLREFVAGTFTDETRTRDRAALLAIIDLMAPADVQEVFQLMAGTVTLIDLLFVGVNRPLFNSVECNEELSFEQFDNSVAAAANLEIPELAYGVLETLAAQFATCEVWPSGRAPAIEALPVTTDVPTLILAGAYDQQTPVSWNKLAFVNLPNASFVEFPMSGHGVIGFSDCAGEVASRFIAEPAAAPDTACTAELKPRWVLPGDAAPSATPNATPAAG